MPIGSDRFRSWILVITLAYVAIQIAYVQRLPLVMDEFDGAYEAHRLHRETPYRDFKPYKTVLGYYLQFPATLLASSVWGRLVALKIAHIAINAAMLAAAAFYCARFLRPAAVAVALALLVASTPMLERSSEIRVDMLTAWAGLWGLLFLIDRRFALAGLFCAISFGISQKAALYVLSSNAVLVLALIFEPDRRRAMRALVSFNAASAAALFAYLAFWSVVADPVTVVRTTFVSASRTAVNAAYDIQWRFWSQVLSRNFMMFILTAVALWWLLRPRDGGVAWHARAAAIYAATLLLLCAVYTQPWPYFFVLLFPTLFVLVAAFLDQQNLTGWRGRALAACLIIAIAYPLHRVFVVVGRDNAYQRYNVALASALLGPGDQYLAANDIIHDREQASRRLARLDAIALRVLAAEGAAAHERLVRDLEERPPKLVIATYRIYNLPPALLTHIDQTYARISGSIKLYAPLIAPGSSWTNLRFPGRYRVEVVSGESARIDGHEWPAGTMLDLRAGSHQVTTPAAMRLRFLPVGIETVIDPQYAAEQPFYSRAYD